MQHHMEPCDTPAGSMVIPVLQHSNCFALALTRGLSRLKRAGCHENVRTVCVYVHIHDHVVHTFPAGELLDVVWLLCRAPKTRRALWSLYKTTTIVKA